MTTTRPPNVTPAEAGVQTCGVRVALPRSAGPAVCPAPSGGQAPALHFPAPLLLDSRLRGNDERGAGMTKGGAGTTSAGPAPTHVFPASLVLVLGVVDPREQWDHLFAVSPGRRWTYRPHRIDPGFRSAGIHRNALDSVVIQ